MVRGIQKFRDCFKEFTGSYIIIGGTACDIAIDQAGLKPRATKDMRKHKNDVFRLASLLSADNKFLLPDALKTDLHRFIGIVKEDLPDISIFQEMGIRSIDVQKLFQQFCVNFNITVNR